MRVLSPPFGTTGHLRVLARLHAHGTVDLLLCHFKDPHSKALGRAIYVPDREGIMLSFRTLDRHGEPTSKTMQQDDGTRGNNRVARSRCGKSVAVAEMCLTPLMRVAWDPARCRVVSPRLDWKKHRSAQSTVARPLLHLQPSSQNVHGGPKQIRHGTRVVGAP